MFAWLVLRGLGSDGECAGRFYGASLQTADLVIQVSGVHNLTSSDFVFISLDGGGAAAGGWSKMSDEALVREREPIERARARLEALVRANAAPRFGARSKRTGKPCRAAAMPNGRCKLHGGKSTGPRTPEGLERSRRANLYGSAHVGPGLEWIPIAPIDTREETFNNSLVMFECRQKS